MNYKHIVSHLLL